MRATYKDKNGAAGVFEHPVVISQVMQEKDGFTLLGFEDWEQVHKEEITAAVTNLAEFHIKKGTVGFNEKPN